MYVADMTLAEAYQAQAELRSQQFGRLEAGRLEQLRWDLEDVRSRIADLEA